MTESGVQAVTTMGCKATQSTVEVKVCYVLIFDQIKELVLLVFKELTLVFLRTLVSIKQQNA